MKQVAGVLLLIVALASAEIKLRNAKDFLTSSVICIKKLEVPEKYYAQFSNFEYKDDATVQNYVLCTLKNLDLWDNDKGMDVESIAASFENLIEEANAKELVPIIRNCNKKNASQAKWAYDGFKCMLSTKTGDWFRELINTEAAKSAA